MKLHKIVLFLVDFGINSSIPTIYASEVRYQHTLVTGSIVGPSFFDIKMINSMYSCTCPTPLTCRNSGYTNPSNCCSCLCAAGFGGADCTSKAPASNGDPNCGGVISVSV